MFKNYCKIAWRNLLRQKVLAFINIFGLSIGVACFILLLLYAVNEFSFDRFHKNEKNIYRVYEWTKALDGNEEGSVSMPMPLGPALKKDMPDILDYVRLKLPSNESFIRIDDDIRRVRVTYADPQLFSVFTFPLKHGNVSTALRDLNSLVITESKAEELFGEDNVVGRIVQIKVDDVFMPFVISGVAGNIPANSSIGFDVIGSFAFLETTRLGKLFNNWYTTSFRTYVQVKPGSNLPEDEARLINFRKTYSPDDGTTSKKAAPRITYGLQSLRSIHTDTRLSDAAGDIAVAPKTIWIILSIAGAILLIAGINFTTLAIGRSAGRSKEVGVRKILGSLKKQLILQFLIEALLLSVISTITGLLLAKLSLPYFNYLSGRDLQFSFALYPEMSWLLICVVLVVALISGSYPALLISKFRPIEVLKNKMHIGGSNKFTRSLVTLQFALSICLIISTLIILQQTNYLKGRNPGFNKENVVVVDAVQTDTKSFTPLLREKLSSQAGIIGVSAAEGGLAQGSDIGMHGFNYKGTHKTIYEYKIDPDYIKVLGMELIAGRNFTTSITDDTTTSVIINEAMMNNFGWTLKDAIGQQIKGYTNSHTPVVIGVVKNFNFQVLSEKIQPQLFYQFGRRKADKFYVRIKPGNPAPILASVQKAWKSVVTDAPFKYSFLDEDLDKLYKSEQRWSIIVGCAGGISIFLACLGLFGLAMLASVNRTKEIGIRKVLGASITNIVALISGDFLKLIVIAFFIASPIAWYFMDNWLQSFAYRINIGWLVFVLAGIFALVVALISICSQAVKTAIANPVVSLRSE